MLIMMEHIQLYCIAPQLPPLFPPCHPHNCDRKAGVMLAMLNTSKWSWLARGERTGNTADWVMPRVMPDSWHVLHNVLKERQRPTDVSETRSRHVPGATGETGNI